ncbi:MAG: FAD binding domain-containing protein [Solirubrobacterales bacterium]|nr:FAD binding domain-containing protein [Solirubrobacterales bacterium]MBV9714955.1 FAD binding domain-containing protein [Solirubrobacterales bacterium]
MLAGGQSLVQLLKFRRCRPSALVDINGIPGLDAIERRDGELHVGALVRQQALLDDPQVAESWPLLREAAGFVGYPETRRRGTLAGSLAFAAPWAELTAAAVALDAQLDICSAAGQRSLAAREFFRGPGETALGDGELIVAVRFPAPAPGTGAAFHEVSVRHRDYAQVAAAAQVSPDGHGELVLLCVAPTPHRVDVSEALTRDDAIADLLGRLDPLDDVEASASYRQRVAPVLARRALRDAAERAHRRAPA